MNSFNKNAVNIELSEIFIYFIPNLLFLYLLTNIIVNKRNHGKTNQDRFELTIESGVDNKQALYYLEIILLEFRNESPFLSYEWMSAWLYSLPYSPLVALLKQNSNVVGMCFIGENHTKLFGITVKTAFLNQMGDVKSDQVWIEYNDVICKEEYKPAFYAKLYTELAKLGFDKFFTSMTTAKVENTIDRSINSSKYSTYSTGYLANLEPKQRTLEKPFISSNTRSQIKRSNKKIEELFGIIKVHRSETYEGRNSTIEKLANLHRLQWKHTAEGSGFDNKRFREHHKHLSKQAPSFLDVVEVKAGEIPLGYCMNLLHGKKVYFYCSGINHAIASKHVKPGYTLHTALMDNYAQQGFTHYDFLGGEARYKSSLSTEEITFCSTTILLPTFKGRVLALLYWLKNKLS